MASKKHDLLQSRKLRRNWLIIGLTLFAITALSFPSCQAFDISDLEVGKPSPRTFQVDRSYRIRDTHQTENRVETRLKEVQPQFVEDESAKQTIINSLHEKIDRLQQQYADTTTRSETVPRTEEGWRDLRENTTQVVEYLLDRGIVKSKQLFERFDQQRTALIQRETVEQKIVTEERSLSSLRDQLVSLDRIKQIVEGTLDNIYRDYEYHNLSRELILESVKPTVFWKENQYENELQSIQDPGEWVYQEYSPGDIVLASGESVTERDYALLKQINQQEIRFQLVRGLASLGIALLGLALMYFYLKFFNPEILNSFYKLGLICLLVVFTTAVTKLIDLAGTGLGPVEYVIPFAAPIMLVSIMIGPQVAFILSIFLGFLVVSFFQFTFELFAMFVIGAFLGVFSILHVERRSVLIQSGLLIGAGQALSVFFFYFLRTGNFFTTDLGFRIIWSGVNGIVIVPLLVIGLLPFLENLFNITTNFKLMELADLNHPLLKELFEHAPGTFQHSLMLSNLCERAAREIGANALLVRVASYYHDLGKGEISEYFIENQGERENPHDDLKPSLSASILRSHVKKGVERARDAGLPKEIIDLIEQHHGTTTMQYFYHRALEKGDDSVSEEEFQYPGPRPQTREAGICMLGDAVEAATRTLEDPTPNSIRDMIEEIVYEKFKDGQLNECDLTLMDLDRIVDTFTRVITSVHHQRIEYPDEMDTEQLEQMRDVGLPKENLNIGDVEEDGE